MVQAENKKSYRRKLFIWGIGEIILAIGVLFFWQNELGILYWIKGIIFTIIFLFGLLCIKDGFFASDTDILKKMYGGSRDNLELKNPNGFLSKLKKLQNKYPWAFVTVVVIFMILYLSNFYIPEKQIIEAILIVVIIIFGIPVIVFW